MRPEDRDSAYLWDMLPAARKVQQTLCNAQPDKGTENKGCSINVEFRDENKMKELYTELSTSTRSSGQAPI